MLSVNQILQDAIEIYFHRVVGVVGEDPHLLKVFGIGILRANCHVSCTRLVDGQNLVAHHIAYLLDRAARGCECQVVVGKTNGNRS